MVDAGRFPNSVGVEVFLGVESTESRILELVVFGKNGLPWVEGANRLLPGVGGARPPTF